MATDTSDLNVFREGISHLLQPLIDDVDDKTTTTIVGFALQMVGTCGKAMDFRRSSLHQDYLSQRLRGKARNKSVVVIATFYKAASTYVSHSVINDILVEMSDSEDLFPDDKNMPTFANMCMACGPKSDKRSNHNGITSILNRASARASTKSVLSQLVGADIIATRESDWRIEQRLTRLHQPRAKTI
ncbi:hypothetical protein E8E12_007318 [Didymella heteroderae]|uniref:Uncharacterized protein n=1 Tax=Didymella heteroderae TaxID=1769908 RepID=A0A9P5C4Q0_9PLEO|nr:hypothetical protein E8E12_007318 [Didymella heteroderae]